MVVEITRASIKEIVDNNQIVIFDFWAIWCGPCKRFAPIFESVAAKHPDIVFAKVNTDEEQELASMFEIQSIPSVAVIKEKEIVFVQPGAISEDVLEAIVKRAKDLDMEEVRKNSK